MADRWKAFRQELAEEMGKLSQPPFEMPTVKEDAEPTVTILDGGLGAYQQGQRLTLSQANQLVREQSGQYAKPADAPALRVKLEYMAEGRGDSYTFPVKLNEPGDLLDHMQAWVDSYRADTGKIMQFFDSAPEQHQDKLRGLLAPILRDSLNDLSAHVVGHLRRHCEISALEQQLHKQAQALPASAQRNFYQTTKESIAALRQAANTQMITLQARPAPVRESSSQQERPSVRAQLQRNKAKQAVKAAPHRVKAAPQR